MADVHALLSPTTSPTLQPPKLQSLPQDRVCFFPTPESVSYQVILTDTSRYKANSFLVSTVLFLDTRFWF